MTHRKTRYGLLIFASLLAVLLVAGCGSGSSSKTATTGKAKSGKVIDVGIVAGKMRFDPEKIDTKAGTVTFKFTNSEDIPHDFVIELDGKKIAGTDLISNDSAEITVDLKTGQYDFFCTPHRTIGMVGKLNVS